MSLVFHRIGLTCWASLIHTSAAMKLMIPLGGVALFTNVATNESATAFLITWTLPMNLTTQN